MDRAIEGSLTPQGKSLWTFLARNAAGNFGLKVSSGVLAFVASLLLARLLGAAGYGAFAFTMAWIGLLVIPAACGFDMLIVRHVAACEAKSEWGEMRGILRRADHVVLVTSLTLAAFTGALVWGLHGRVDPQMLSTLWWALPLLPLTAFIRLRRAALQGLHYPMLGHLSEWLIVPLLFVVFIAAAAFLIGRAMRPSHAVLLNIAAAATACFVGTFLLQARLPTNARCALPAYHTRAWVKAALPMVSVTALVAINTQADLLFLGLLKGPAPAGLYAAAQKGCLAVSLVLGVGNSVWGPVIARLHTLGDRDELQRVVTVCVRVISLLALPVALGLTVFGYWFLLLFGPEFPRAHLSLAILCFGQFINVAMGPVGVILMMTGFERDVAKMVLISVLTNVVLNAMFVPPWGMTGAAIATTVSLVLLNILLAIRVRQKTGIRPTAMG